MENKIKILVCAHKKDEHTRTQAPYFPIQVGKALHPDLDLGYTCDNTGSNISSKNASWCELTALYWGWKNIHNVDFLGLNHYRRYFKTSHIENAVNRYLDGQHPYDMIVSKVPSNFSNHQRFKDLICVTSMEDAYLFADTFLSMYPQYHTAFHHYFFHSRKSYPFQLFIAKKAIYDEYCAFMFPVLEHFEQKSKQHGYTRQKRVMGYIGEFFLGLFIECKKLRVKPIELECYTKEKAKFSIKNLIKRIPCIIGDCFYKQPKCLQVPDAVKVGFINDKIDLLYLK
mgnify:CR=1 FL=1